MLFFRQNSNQLYISRIKFFFYSFKRNVPLVLKKQAVGFKPRPRSFKTNGTILKKSSAFIGKTELFCFIYLSTEKRSVNPRHQNNAEFLLTIHLDYHRLFKADMTQEFRFFHRRLGVEEILIVDSVIHKGIDCKIAYTE